MMSRHLQCSRVCFSFIVGRITKLTPPLSLRYSTPRPLLVRIPTSLPRGKKLGMVSSRLLSLLLAQVAKKKRKYRKRRFTDSIASCLMGRWFERVMSTDAAMPTYSTDGSCWNRELR